MRFLTFPIAFAAFVFAVLSAPTSRAAEILENGNLESSVAPVNWSISTSITEIPNSTIPSVFEHNDGSNNPPTSGLGILIKPQAGNQGIYDGLNYQTNFMLEQIRTGIPVGGRAYTLTGDSFWGGSLTPDVQGYSGGVTLMHTQSPSDPTPENADDPPSVPSPTQTTVEVAFLNNANDVLGTPAVLDLRTVQQNDATWRTFTMPNSMPGMTADPAATKIRVRLSATNMKDNFGYQNFFLDNFSLKDNISTGVERLQNNNLNIPGEPAGWTVSEGPSGPSELQGGVSGPVVTADSAAFVSNANHTSSGAQGLWLRPFVNTTQFAPDLPNVFATMAQKVPAEEGAEYDFSAWTAWEWGFSGGLDNPSLRSPTLLKMEFLNGSDVPIGSALTLDLYGAGMRNDQDGPSNNIEPEDWQQFTLSGTAPGGTASVRVSIDAQGMFNTSTPNGEPMSAFFDDLSLLETLPGGQPGDHNQDSVVNAADYVAWRKIPSLFGDDAGYTTWRENFGEGGTGSSAPVPEPAALALLIIGVVGTLAIRRRDA